MEGFAQQLLTGGLAQNESPRAGKQLFDRRKKKRRQEWMQTLTNILYIKIPIIDPDRILKRMTRWLGWIFSAWFFLCSIGLMLSAVVLVGVNFNKFLDKLPDYHEFFTFKTVVNLWAALAVVKVIHEFGHGLSCKKFGGEVHEMGALFLCLSPALYCNVSDAWTLPNKWHRIIISSAGIYVELVIASIATWVWWYTPTQPYFNNMALALMVVCSVSTVVFNANPLMRYDGYYVLADWLEIPNLRERANRFLSNLVQEHCLGIEVQPEGYMALWRRLLFVFYAVASYIYKWVVTFGIIWFFTSFLKPYKLEVVGQMLAVASLASMLGWPLYRLGKNLYKRGRLPDMKRWRVVTTGLVLTALVLFLALVPLPLNKVRGKGLVEPQPDASIKVYVRYPGVLEKLNVHTGQHVEQGEELAVFRNIELEQRAGRRRQRRAGPPRQGQGRRGAARLPLRPNGARRRGEGFQRGGRPARQRRGQAQGHGEDHAARSWCCWPRAPAWSARRRSSTTWANSTNATPISRSAPSTSRASCASACRSAPASSTASRRTWSAIRRLPTPRAGCCSAA